VTDTLEIKVPDIGGFEGVPVVEVLVATGDTVSEGDSLIVLESEKAAMDVPAPQGGKIVKLAVAVGDEVSQGSVLAVIEVASVEGGASSDPAPDTAPDAAPASTPAPSSAPAAPAGGGTERGDAHAQLLVLGSGPGGYAAAFRAADLGLDVVLVERGETVGGVCLNVGCIPSKALLHAAKVITDAEAMAEHGVGFGAPKIDLDTLRGWKEGVVDQLVQGVTGMAKQRKVRVVRGAGTFTGPHMLEVTSSEGTSTVSFDHAIVATGSRPVELPGVPTDDDRVIDSTGALELADVPKRLLVIGGGIIGLEMATVYDALGSKVTIVELASQLVPGADLDLVKPLHDRVAKRYEAIHLDTKVEEVIAQKAGLKVRFSGDVKDATFDRVLVAVGRRPNGADLGLDAAGVQVDERGFVTVDEHLRTNVAHIHAIGDVAGQPMLAHKATAEGHVAAEVIAGEEHAAWDVRAIPSVAYTEPEIAWIGLTETVAKRDGHAYEVASFPWSASGRALAMDASAGKTKLLFDPETKHVLGAGVVGSGAGELVAEVGLAIEMGATVEDIAATVHAHPTLSESVGLAAELAHGTITDLPNRRAARSR